MAREVAQLLAQCRTMSRGRLLYNIIRSRDEQSCNTAKVANYAYPYVLALIQFCEEYRYRLAGLVIDPNKLQTYSDQVEELLLAKYNEKTVNGLCALYHILLDLLRFTIPEEKHLSMIKLLGIARTNYLSSVLNNGEHLDLFTFGGLELFTHVIRLPYQASDIVMAHFSRVTPIQLPATYDGQSHSAFVPLCRSTLPPVNDVNNVTATKIRTLLPSAAALLVNGSSEHRLDEERAGVLDYLSSGDEEKEGEEEPKLLM